MTMRRTYLDWNASAPLRPEALDAMRRALDVTGNPSSVHREGRAARRLIEDAREQIAALAGARPAEVIFTSGATEANNAVIRSSWGTIFAAGIEHDSVLAPIVDTGAQLVAMPVGTNGVVDLAGLAADFAAHAAVASIARLATLQAANNETGVLQPVAGLAELARKHRIRVHSDATQVVGRVPVSFASLDIDYLTLSSHKIGGPKGAGALIVRAGAPLMPWQTGGGQERRQRAGTENPAAIAGFGAAAAAVKAELGSYERVASLRDRLEDEVLRFAPDATIIGRDATRLANTSCFALGRRSAETLVTALDLAGVAVSAGAACSSGKVAASHVLSAMGLAPEITGSAIRVSIGPTTTEHDIAAFIAAWANLTRGVAQAA